MGFTLSGKCSVMVSAGLFRRLWKGQAVVEYMLLLTIVAGMSAILLKVLVSRDEESPGALIVRWYNVLQAIAEDDPARVGKVP